MKNIQLIILVLVCLFVCLFSSCSEKSKINENLEIDKIEVYYIPFHITSMMGGSIESIKQLDKFVILEREKIDSIKNELLSLKKLKENEDFTDSSIHLLCEFYYKDKKVFTFFYDNLNFKINNNLYYKDTELLNLLISNAKWHGDTSNFVNDID